MGNLAPNGKKSNLTPEQYKLVRTAAFKKWFGDWERLALLKIKDSGIDDVTLNNISKDISKVVDENGEPLVVYHGTNVKEQFNIFDFDKADLGFHFGTYQQANDRSETKIAIKGYKKIITSYFLNIRKLFSITDIGEFEYPQRYLNVLLSDNLITEKEAKENGFFNAYYKEDNKIIRDFLVKKYKNIGFEYNNQYEGKGKSFITLNNNQMKLADGSNTTFDAENTDIRYKVGGSLSKTPSPLKDRIKGSKVNKEGSAASTKSAFNIEFVESTIKTLENKRDEYNEKHPKNKVSLATLKAVFRRGAGAYSTSHRPNISRSGWAFARVNKFLLKKGGTKVKSAYIQDDDLMEKGGLLAPNLKPSNLTPEQYKLVRTPEFKAWFGDWENDPENSSKVVDTNGEPLVVYHGTNIDFTKFDIKQIGKSTNNLGHYGYGFYFSDDIRESKNYGNKILNCYLNIRKPFLATDKEFDLLKENGFYGIDDKVNLSIDFKDLHKKIKQIDKNAYYFMSIAEQNGLENVWDIYLDSKKNANLENINLNDLYDILLYTNLTETNDEVPQHIIDDIEQIGIIPKLNVGYKYIQSLHWVTDLGNNSKIFTDFVKELNYDGVIIGSEYVAFYPNQIKLADGSNTMFDANNPDIRYEQGGNIGQEITCVNCGWHWNTNQSDEFDKYICHKCGFDNRTFYDSEPIGYNDGGMLKTPHTIYEIAKKHNVSLNVIKDALKQGINTEKEHTNDISVAKTISLHHLYESPSYYNKLQKMEKLFKNGGEIIEHGYGKIGGVLVGRRHSEGGIKAVNKATNQPLEMEGGEVVITRNAVSDDKKREFEGKMMTNKEILSAINESGGGVSFAKGGKTNDCGCSGKSYKYGGKMMTDFDIVNAIQNASKTPNRINQVLLDMSGIKYAELKPSEAMQKLFGGITYKKGGNLENTTDYLIFINKRIPSLNGFLKLKEKVNSPLQNDNEYYIPIKQNRLTMFARGGNIEYGKITNVEAYKTYLYDKHGIKFKELPVKIQNALLMGKQSLIDNYINE